IAGRVMHGQKLGRQLGTPTANVQLKRTRVPLQGVYLASALFDGRRHPGVANIGMRPTVQGDVRAHLEVHLLDYTGDLYGKRISVAFHHKRRDEQRFASLVGRKTAIDAEITPARANLEVHLLDYTGDLYGKRISVAFHHKLRDEQRFASLDELKTAIDADIAAARAYWLGQPLQSRA